MRFTFDYSTAMSVMGWCTITFVGIIISFSVVFAGKRDMIISVKGSWLSSENFSAMINASLEKAKCSNVYISGDSVAIKTIFNDFVGLYQYEYMVTNMSYYCNGYLMISTSENRLRNVLKAVPTKSSAEILIILDNDIVESSMLFNVSMYQYANVNIVTRNGLWTLSEHFLEPRIFKQVSSHHELLHRRGIMNLHGRALQAAAFFQPPLCYLYSTINRTVKGVEGEFFTAKNDAVTLSKEESELDGVEVKLFMLIAERLNFTWTIRKPNHYYRFGRRNGTNWYGGMIGQIYRNEVDIAFTNIWMTLDHYQFANMSHPWTQLSIHFLVPRPQPRRTFRALSKPFSLEVWSAIFVMLITQSVYVYVKAWVSPEIPNRFRNFIATLTELMARLVGVWVSARIRGLKIQLQLWHFVGILLVTAYSSNLAARLTSIHYEKRIDTLQDFIAANLSWGRELPEPLFSNYFDESDPYARQVPGHFEIDRNEAHRHSKILNGNYAIIGRIIGTSFWAENQIGVEDLKGYRVMKKHTAKFYTTFIVQPWLLESVSKVILRMQETGLILYHLYDVIHRRTPFELREVFIERDIGSGVPRVLKLSSLGIGFSILILGHTLSSIVFFIELKYVSGKRRMLQILRQIKQKS